MKILLTGASGMVGRNILENTYSSQFQFLKPGSKELNLLNGVEVESYVLSQKPDVIIHCAGLVGGIHANMREPVRFLVENLEMGKNLMLAAKKLEKVRFINMASSCMYPKDHQGHLEEEMVLTGPLEPTNEGYALAKISVMRLGQFINQETKSNSFKTLIPCNLYGRWDKFSEANSHMVPAVIRKTYNAVQKNQPELDIWGSGNARREFMYAADLADFVFFALDHWDRVPDLINVGLGHDYSINDYYHAIAKITGFKGTFTHDLTKPEGMKKKVVSTKKADQLGWKAQTSLEDGLRKTFEFFLEKEIP